MRKWQAIPVAAVVTLLAGAALFSAGTPAATHAAVAQPNLSLVCRVNPGCTFGSGTASIDVDVVLTNASGADITVSSFGFDVYNPAAAFLAPSVPTPNLAFQVTPVWSCASPAPLADTGDYTATGGTASSISCINGSASETLANGASAVIATVHFVVSGNNTADLLLINASVADANTVELINSCTPVEAKPTKPATFQPGVGSCTGATVSVGAGSATNTPAATATSTATPAPTSTPCVTGCPLPTSLAYATITPSAGTQTATAATATARTAVPATAVPGGPPPPPPPPTGNQPGGGAGAGSSRPILLPDTGAGANNGIDWTAAVLLSLLAVAIGGATGALYFGAAHVSASRRGRDG